MEALTDGSRPLSNPKKEKFCRLVVSGMPVIDAHEAAGYARSKANARRLKAEEAVSKRVDYLQREAASKVVSSVAAVSEEILYTRLHAMREAEQALQLAIETKNPSALVSAVTLRAKLNNLIVDQKKVEKIRRLDDMSREELEALLADVRAERQRAAGTRH